MTAPGWASRYVGVPFLDGGRGLDGLDCWGLVRLVLAREAGVDVPAYGDTPAADLAAVARSMLAESQVGPWRSVAPAEARALDVVVMSGRVREGGAVRRVPVHVGILVGPGWLLHVEEATAACIVPLTHPTVRHRIVGFHRHATIA